MDQDFDVPVVGGGTPGNQLHGPDGINRLTEY
jgi:hypothetical protein